MLKKLHDSLLTLRHKAGSAAEQAHAEAARFKAEEERVALLEKELQTLQAERDRLIGSKARYESWLAGEIESLECFRQGVLEAFLGDREDGYNRMDQQPQLSRQLNTYATICRLEREIADKPRIIAAYDAAITAIEGKIEAFAEQHGLTHS